MDKLVAIAASMICGVGMMTARVCAAPSTAVAGPAADVAFSDPASLQPRFAAMVGDRVFFPPYRSTLTGEARAALAKQAAWLSRRTPLAVVIAGHCDAQEAKDAGVDLAARRVDAVFDYLSDHGVAFVRIRKVSYRADRPFDGGTSPGALARNRSAQIILVDLSSR